MGDKVHANIEESFVVGKVKNVTDGTLNQQLLKSTGIVTHKQIAQIEIMEGPLKGTTLLVPNELTDNPAFNVEAKPGHELILSVVTDNGSQPEINIADYHRVPVLAGLLMAFLVVFLYFGGKQGLKSLLGLVIGIVLIASVLLPFSFHGFDPLLSAAGICMLMTVTTCLLVAGFSRKALAATLGTLGGVIVSGIAAHLVIAAAPLTGLSTEEAQILRGSVLNQPPQFYSGLLAAGMLIGALGVIMDVAVSIASAISEVADANCALNRSELYRKGMNVGRDIMGTMTNTLVLAYTGSALPLLLLMSQVPSTKLLNLDLVATEVAAALSGSLGLICTIPLTALAASWFMSPRTAGDYSMRTSAASTSASATTPNPEEAEFERLLWSHRSSSGSKES
jgi:uncharacterized membrane protein